MNPKYKTIYKSRGRVKIPNNVVSFNAFKIKRDLNKAFQSWPKGAA